MVIPLLRIRGAATCALALALGSAGMPLLLIWLLRQRRQRSREGLDILLPFMARTIERYAALTLHAFPPEGGWAAVARNVDRYVASTQRASSARIWRIRGLLVLMELAPLLDGAAPFALLSTAGRRRFIERRIEGQRGLFALVGMGRQLVRFGYYACPCTAQDMGYAPMGQRGVLTRRRRAQGRQAAPGRVPARLELVS